MNTISPFPIQMLENEVHQSASVLIALLFGAALGGYYFIDTVKRWRALEKQLTDLEAEVHESDSVEQANFQMLEEMDQRIREKQDYDESEEIQEGKYQAWRGEYLEDSRKVEIQLWREKESTLKKNQEWVSPTGIQDGSIVAREYYLGNQHPEFCWEIRKGDYYFIAVATDTFVESWDTVIKLEIYMTFPSQDSLLESIEAPYYNGNVTVNASLKKCLEKNLIQWQKVLIDPK